MAAVPNLVLIIITACPVGQLNLSSAIIYGKGQVSWRFMGRGNFAHKCNLHNKQHCCCNASQLLRS